MWKSTQAAAVVVQPTGLHRAGGTPAPQAARATSGGRQDEPARNVARGNGPPATELHQGKERWHRPMDPRRWPCHHGVGVHVQGAPFRKNLIPNCLRPNYSGCKISQVQYSCYSLYFMRSLKPAGALELDTNTRSVCADDGYGDVKAGAQRWGAKVSQPSGGRRRWMRPE